MAATGGPQREPQAFEGLRRQGHVVLAIVAPVVLAAGLIPAAATASPLKVRPSSRCSDTTDNARRLDLKIRGESTFGYFALPKGRPKGLVVFGHGFPRSAIQSRSTVREIARRAGAVAVAMDFRHQGTDLDPHSPTFGLASGWRVIEGGVDSIAAAREMMRRCERLRRLPVVAYGLSMGANATALALARGADRPGGRPLFDYWFDIEGAVDIVSLYKVAAAFRDSDPEMAYIAAGMEEEFRGTYDEVPGVYERNSPINLAPAIAASGVKGVVIIIASDDGSYIWNRTMFDRLHQAAVPTQFFTVEPVSGPVGHGMQPDLNHPVIRAGFDRLAALFKDRVRPRCDQEFSVNSESGAITPDPAGTACH